GDDMAAIGNVMLSSMAALAKGGYSSSAAWNLSDRSRPKICQSVKASRCPRTREWGASPGTASGRSSGRDRDFHQRLGKAFAPPDDVLLLNPLHQGAPAADALVARHA